jgi:hypothetical protein
MKKGTSLTKFEHEQLWDLTKDTPVVLDKRGRKGRLIEVNVIFHSGVMSTKVQWDNSLIVEFHLAEGLWFADSKIQPNTKNIVK